MAVSKIFSGQDILEGRRTVLGESGPLYPSDSGGLSVYTSADGIMVDGRYLSGPWADGRGGEVITTSDTATAAISGDAVLYYGAVAGGQHVLGGVAFGYDATPVSGVLTIDSPSGTTIFSEPITAAGAGFFSFGDGLRCGRGDDVLISLSDGSTGKSVSLMGRKVE